MRDVRRNRELKAYWLNKITVAATITTAFNLSGTKMQARTQVLNNNRICVRRELSVLKLLKNFWFGKRIKILAYFLVIFTLSIHVEIPR